LITSVGVIARIGIITRAALIIRASLVIIAGVIARTSLIITAGVIARASLIIVAGVITRTSLVIRAGVITRSSLVIRGSIGTLISIARVDVIVVLLLSVVEEVVTIPFRHAYTQRKTQRLYAATGFEPNTQRDLNTNARETQSSYASMEDVGYEEIYKCIYSWWGGALDRRKPTRLD
jgi:hypothetical protein